VTDYEPVVNGLKLFGYLAAIGDNLNHVHE